MKCRAPNCGATLRANQTDFCTPCSFNLPLATLAKIRATPRPNGVRRAAPQIEGDGAVRAGERVRAAGLWRKA